MFASIGLPGLSGFVGEFLVALGAWDYNPVVALLTFAVVIFAAWYMMWMFQRIIFGRAPGEAPDPHDGELTAEEREELAVLAAQGGHGHGHGGHGHAAPLPVSGGSHEHRAPRDADPSGTQDIPDVTSDADRVQAAAQHAEDAHGAHGHDDHGGLTLDKDLTRKEILTLFPLAVATVVFGVYPKPLFDIVEPSFQRILAPFI
jgi:hypothetical protein